LILSITIEANNVVKYSFKQNSNQAFASLVWQQSNLCLTSALNYFSLYAADGLDKASGSNKESINLIRGYLDFYSNCDSIGATYTRMFFSTEAVSVSELKFTALTAAIATNLTTNYEKFQCIILSETEFGEETNPYYDCVVIERGIGSLSVDTIIQVSKDSYKYMSIGKSVDPGPGYVYKESYKRHCNEAFPTMNVLTFNKVPILLGDYNEYSSSSICKAQSGSTERITFN
jgi:hypothetical protein